MLVVSLFLQLQGSCNGIHQCSQSVSQLLGANPRAENPATFTDQINKMGAHG